MDMLEFVVPALNIKVLAPLIIIIVTALTVLLVDVFYRDCLAQAHNQQAQY